MNDDDRESNESTANNESNKNLETLPTNDTTEE